MDTRVILDKAKENMAELEEEYKKMKGRANLATRDLEIEFKMKMHELRLKLDELNEGLQEQGEAGKKSWKVLAKGFDRAASELKSAFREAWAKFKE